MGFALLNPSYACCPTPQYGRYVAAKIVIDTAALLRPNLCCSLREEPGIHPPTPQGLSGPPNSIRAEIYGNGGYSTDARAGSAAPIEKVSTGEPLTRLNALTAEPGRIRSPCAYRWITRLGS